MAKVFFDNPMTPAGDEQEQLKQLYSYLYTMSEKLNEALNAIGTDQMEPEVQVAIRNAGNTAEEREKTYTTLKSLIIKTAEIVRHEMSEISVKLTDDYEAISSLFGEYERSLESTITATAEGILQDYAYDERINSVDQELDGFRRKTNQYIFSGLVDEENMKYGIAIGYNVTSQDEDGNEILNDQNKMATFTSDELTFYVDAQRVAWFANDVFYINRGRVNQSMQIGNNFAWKVMSADGGGNLVLVKL